MSEKSTGPATRTRSRITSGMNGEEVYASANKSSKKLSATPKNGQKLVSEYLKLSIDAENYKCNSDSELVVQKLLKKRSKSGKIYKSQVEFPAKSTERRINITQEFALGASQVNNRREMSHSDSGTMEGANGGETIIPYKTFMQQVGDNAADVLKGNVNGSVTTTSSAAINTTTITTTSAITDVTYTASNSVSSRCSPTYSSTQPSLGQSNQNTVSSSNMGDFNIAALLQKMDNKLTNIQNDMTAMKAGQTSIREELAGIQFDQEDDHEAILHQGKELSSNQDKVDLLTDIILRYEDKQQVLTGQMSNSRS